MNFIPFFNSWGEFTNARMRVKFDYWIPGAFCSNFFLYLEFSISRSSVLTLKHKLCYVTVPNQIHWYIWERQIYFYISNILYDDYLSLIDGDRSLFNFRLTVMKPYEFVAFYIDWCGLRNVVGPHRPVKVLLSRIKFQLRKRPNAWFFGH